MAEDAVRKVCEVFGFERLNKHQEKALRLIIESKGDVFVNLPTGFGKSVVFQALPVVYSHVEPSREKNIVIVVSPLVNLRRKGSDDRKYVCCSQAIQRVSPYNCNFMQERISSGRLSNTL